MLARDDERRSVWNRPPTQAVNDSIRLPTRPIPLHELVQHLRQLHAGETTGPGLRLSPDEERWVAAVIFEVAETMPGLAPYVFVASPGCVRIEWDVVGWDVWASLDATDQMAQVSAVRDTDGVSRVGVAHGDSESIAAAVIQVMQRIDAQGNVEVVPRKS